MMSKYPPADVPSSPSGSRTTTVAQLLIAHLKAEGVSKIFGIPGGTVVWIMAELKRQAPEIEYVICRHEGGAAFMADGYARVSGKLGVVLTTSGPGATNALSGAINAQASNSSVLVITGEVPEKYFGQGYLQEGSDIRLNVSGVFRHAVASSVLITNPAHFQSLFKQALRSALSLPQGTAHVSMTNELAGRTITYDAASVEPQSYRARAACTDLKAVRQTLQQLAQARRPLIFLGNGCREALSSPERLATFIAFVERWGIPVMTTPNAKGIFPETHPLSLRNYGICGSAWPALYMKPAADAAHFDTLVVLGSSLGQLTTSVVAREPYSKVLIPRGPFIQFDLDASMIGRAFPVTQGVIAELGATLDALCELAADIEPPAQADERKALIADIKRLHSPCIDAEGHASTQAPVHPAALMRVINEVVTEGQVFIDAGNCVGWSLNHMVVDPPLRYQSALSMGPMGFAAAAVVGAKMAAPDQPCIAIVGDGALMMHGAEISTAAQTRTGAIWIVLDDNDLSMVSQGMEQLVPDRNTWLEYYQLGRPDLVQFARGLGADTVAVLPSDGSEAFKTALSNAIAAAQATSRPQVIVVYIDTRPAPPYGWPELVLPG
jgi:acetolactate synthase-1/2/3 large subunit